MTYENIRFEAADAVGPLTIDRPKSLNALDPDTLREILRLLRDVRRDDAPRARSSRAPARRPSSPAPTSRRWRR